MTKLRNWSRTRKVTALVAAAVVGIGIAAVAVLLVRAPISGEAEVLAPPNVNWRTDSGGEPVITTTGTLTNCTATVMSQTELRVNLSGLPGDGCTVTGHVWADGNTVTMAVQDLTYGPGVLTALRATDCGKAIGVEPFSTPVQMRFTLDADPGTYPASAEAGLVAVPTVEYIDANCPKV